MADVNELPDDDFDRHIAAASCRAAARTIIWPVVVGALLAWEVTSVGWCWQALVTAAIAVAVMFLTARRAWLNGFIHALEDVQQAVRDAERDSA